MLCNHCVSVSASMTLSVDAVPLRGAYFGSGSGDIFLDNVVCRGTESSLLECTTNSIGQHNCDHSEDAGVRCEGHFLKIHNVYRFWNICMECVLSDKVHNLSDVLLVSIRG